MANVGQVLTMLCPNVEWSLIGDKYEDINWQGKEAPITEKEFNEGFAKVDAFLLAEEKAKAEAKASVLERLGITAEEAALLLS